MLAVDDTQLAYICRALLGYALGYVPKCALHFMPLSSDCLRLILPLFILCVGVFVGIAVLNEANNWNGAAQPLRYTQVRVRFRIVLKRTRSVLP